MELQKRRIDFETGAIMIASFVIQSSASDTYTLFKMMTTKQVMGYNLDDKSHVHGYNNIACLLAGWLATLVGTDVPQ